MNITQLADWMPLRIHWERDQPLVEWCYMRGVRFVEPFFDDTIKQCLRRPFSLLFNHQTPLAALNELQTVAPGLQPTGFIFHLSRCGSTLVTQLLAARSQHIVIAEAGPIDAVLRANWLDPAITDEQRIEWLRGLLSAFARPRQAERHFFVKFDSWHTLELPLIQRAFPHTPWIFLYRDPVEVLVSHRRQRGAQMMPDLLSPAWLGLKWTSAMSLDEYCTHVLVRISEAVLRTDHHNALFINYQQLPTAVWGEIASHFGLAYSEAEIDQLKQVARFDAKNPSLFFAEDTAAKMSAATEDIHRLAEQWLLPCYTALEQLNRKEHRRNNPCSTI